MFDMFVFAACEEEKLAVAPVADAFMYWASTAKSGGDGCSDVSRHRACVSKIRRSTASVLTMSSGMAQCGFSSIIKPICLTVRAVRIPHEEKEQ